jgi:hypothetical protein
VSIRYVELADYLAIAAEITGLDTTTLIRVTKVDLAESALHAPAAGFGKTEFYPDFIDKAAVLLVRLAKNHPLPDGNKRAAWVGWWTARRGKNLTMRLVRLIRTRHGRDRALQCTLAPLHTGIGGWHRRPRREEITPLSISLAACAAHCPLGHTESRGGRVAETGSAHRAKLADAGRPHPSLCAPPSLSPAVGAHWPPSRSASL